MATTRELIEGWEIVSRRTDSPANAVLMILQILLPLPELPLYRSTVTWTVRETATGRKREVTAWSEQEAKDRVALELFDETDAPR